MKNLILIIFTVIFCFSFTSCGKSEAALACEKAILGIGEVTLESEEAIVAAEKAYNALTEKEQKQIEKSANILFESRTDYETAVKLNDVVVLIDEIGDKIEISSESKIVAAEEAYNSLSEEEKEQIKESGEKLASFREEYEKAKKEQIIKEYTTEFDVNHDKVTEITWYQHKNRPAYINTRSYVVPYIGKRDGNVWICIRYNYTGDNWIFWKNITIATDNEKYYKYFSYFSINRDHEHRDVWENYDEVLASNLTTDSYDLKMLKDMSESKKTIIRFQGNHDQYDLILRSTDKNIIKDVLTLYSALIA